MWEEERDIFEALDEHDLETDFIDDFTDIGFDAETDEEKTPRTLRRTPGLLQARSGRVALISP